MPRKQIDACIFCGGNPCQCDGPKPVKKAGPKKSRPKIPSSEATQAPTLDPLPSEQPSIDVKAAMKQAVQSMSATSSVATVEAVRTEARPVPTVEPTSELLDALNNLREIIHPDDLKPYESAMWRRRREQPE